MRQKLMHRVEILSDYSSLYHHPIPSTALELETLLCFWFGLVWFGLVDSYSVPAAKCSYARMPGMADSRRGADVNLHRPTSLSKEPSVPKGLALFGFYLRLCTSRL
jgi:hypothetical protein